ncbi:hypothetical protein SuNHUV7_01360 (plasmid) [Pseudoseohaeicola sp. NH-UV-7]|uniref:hypothetical protein n=1 Tax=unclassified Sulfitobacter TaxID=196795 RepID=UPI0013B4699A|nr:hypothetical protein [Sulfitobacter sp. JL08]
MPVFRLTEFTSRDMSKMVEFAETLREEVAAAGAEFIDVISVGDGKGIVIAKYDTQAKMEAATEINKAAFGKMIAAGIVDAESISGQSGEITFSF